MANRKELAPLRLAKEPPEKLVHEYLHSRKTNEQPKTFPEWDIARMEPSAELVGRRRELYDVDVRLSQKKKDAQKRRKEMDATWKDLEDRELVLRENFVKFNKFVKENQEKRERADRKIAEEETIIEKRNSEIEELQCLYEHMFDIRTQMERNIKSHSVYEVYLRSVVGAYPVFKAVDDILDRYETLADARKILGERQEYDLTALEDARNEMLHITEENTLTIMGLYNVMAELQTRYEVAKTKATQWELLVTRIKDESVAKLTEMQSIRQSAYAVYSHMCRRKQISPKFCKFELEEQLVFIKNYLLELKRTTKLAKTRFDIVVKLDAANKAKPALRAKARFKMLLKAQRKKAKSKNRSKSKGSKRSRSKKSKSRSRSRGRKSKRSKSKKSKSRSRSKGSKSRKDKSRGRSKESKPKTTSTARDKSKETKPEETKVRRRFNEYKEKIRSRSSSKCAKLVKTGRSNRSKTRNKNKSKVCMPKGRSESKSSPSHERSESKSISKKSKSRSRSKGSKSRKSRSKSKSSSKKSKPRSRSAKHKPKQETTGPARCALVKAALEANKPKLKYTAGRTKN